MPSPHPASFEGMLALIQLLEAEAQGDTSGSAGDAAVAAAEALDDLGPALAPVVPQLVTLLGNAHWFSREMACSLLGRVGPAAAAAVPALAERVQDEDSDVRIEACWALGGMGDAAGAAVPALIAAVDDKGQGGHNGYVAVVALGNVGPAATAAVPRLVRVLREAERDDLRSAAAGALLRIGHASDEVIEVLGGDLQGKTMYQWGAIVACAAVGVRCPVALLPALRETANSADANIRKVAVDALRAVGSTSLVPEEGVRND